MIPPGVGRTAIGVAGLRAAESSRPDRLFSDPYAAAFVEAAGWTPAGTSPALAVWVSVRTRFLDELVLDATRSGCEQVVILGAGLDTRALRLPLADGVGVYEVDVPEVLEFKAGVLGSAGPAVAVAADLREDWGAALRAAGWWAGTPTVWVVEGLLVYLSAAENERLVSAVTTGSAPGSRMGLTLDAREAGDRSGAPGAGDGPGAPGAGDGPGAVDGPGAPGAGDGPGAVDGSGYRSLWRSAAPPDPVAWLGGHGWEARLFTTRERAAAYGRPLPGAGGEPPRAWLVDARFGG